MQKWTFFSMGMMAGIILLLVFMLLSQQGENLAYANSMRQDVAGQTGTTMSTGGTQQQITDMVWVLYRRKGGKSGGGSSTKITGDSRLTLACYKVSSGSRGRMSLISVRDITYDVEVVEWPAQTPSVREIKKQLEKESRNNKKDD